MINSGAQAQANISLLPNVIGPGVSMWPNKLKGIRRVERILIYTTRLKARKHVASADIHNQMETKKPS